jgi:hypothetical protein
MRNFAQRVRKNLDADLMRRGFTFAGGAYRRSLPSGVVHGIGFDNRGQDSRRFRIVFFVNAPDLDGQTTGGHLVRYFTGESLSDMPRELACGTEEQLDSVLTRLISHFEQTIEPFLSTLPSCTALATALIQEASLDFYRAQLYSLDGDGRSARAECSLYLKRLAQSLGDAHPHLQEARGLVQALLSEIDGNGRPG